MEDNNRRDDAMRSDENIAPVVNFRHTPLNPATAEKRALEKRVEMLEKQVANLTATCLRLLKWNTKFRERPVYISRDEYLKYVDAVTKFSGFDEERVEYWKETDKTDI